MSVKIKYSNSSSNSFKSNLILFTNSKLNISGLKKNLSKEEFSYIYDLLKAADLKKKIFIFEINSKKKIILISIKDDLKNADIENLGAEFYTQTNTKKNDEYFLVSDTVINKYENFLGFFLHGIKLKSYKFDKYKSKKNIKSISINVIGNRNKPSLKNQIRFNIFIITKWRGAETC